MELGDSESALKHYRTVLRYDPDQKQVSKQYRQLKKLVKMLKQVDKMLEDRSATTHQFYYYNFS
jgi:hypothetical protein